MGTAAWLVWLQGGFARSPTRSALWLFIAQLILKAAWSGIFFALRRPRTALLEILLLWLLIVATVVAFWSVNPLAGALLTPYLAWVAYAARLNAGIVRLNPHLRE
jgi:benzodiazapine receptor